MRRECFRELHLKDRIMNWGVQIEKVSSVILLSFCAVFLCGLSYYCARYTWIDSSGVPYDTMDSGQMNILVLSVISLIGYGIYKVLHKKHLSIKSEQLFIVVMSACLYVISLVWVLNCHVLPRGDGMTLCNVAHRMITGNYVDMKERGYMFIFPHQYSLLSVIHTIFTWFGAMNYKVFQHINAVCVPLLFYSGYKIIKLICGKTGAVISYAVFFVSCLPLFFYVPYVYGEIISITFTMVLIWQVIRFCKNGKKSAFLWGTIAALVACFVRNNSLIVLIAAGIVLVLHALKKASPQGVIWLLVMVLLVSGSQQAIQSYYERISGLKIEEGVPYISWIRMGLQDSWAGPGWFDNTSVEVFTECGYDAELTILAETESLKEQFEFMKNNKAYSVDFFKRKILSQWNAPGYRYIYETRVFDCEPAELPELVWDIYYEDENAIQMFMNRYQFGVYFYAGVLTIFLLADREKRYSLPEHLLYIAIVGGLLFTMMWESGSRYILPYLVYMLPLAAIGMYRMIKGIDEFVGSRKKSA